VGYNPRYKWINWINQDFFWCVIFHSSTCYVMVFLPTDDWDVPTSRSISQVETSDSILRLCVLIRLVSHNFRLLQILWDMRYRSMSAYYLVHLVLIGTSPVSFKGKNQHPPGAKTGSRPGHILT